MNQSKIKSNNFTQSHSLKTAVLFLVFNRLDTTKKVFEAIRKAKPPRLYIAADGTREQKQDEDEKVKAVREYVIANVDWDCEVKTLFREKNLGCKYAVSGAIDWFFENEEMGIILEDDCLPSQSFFWFCEELLDKYKDDMRIGMISGNNFQKGMKRGNGDYYFSIFPHIWGWASWRRVWKYFDLTMPTYPEFKNENYIDRLFIERGSKQYWLNIFNLICQNKIDAWGYYLVYSMFTQSFLSISPNINLVANIGFDKRGVHTTNPNNPIANIKSFEMQFPIIHPKIVMRNYDADEVEEKTIFRQSLSLWRILSKIFYSPFNKV